MSIAQGILRGVQGAQASFRDQRDSTRQRETLDMARERQDILNTEENERLQVQGFRETIGNIAQHTGNITEEQDYLKVYQERPEEIVRLSNLRPEFNTFTKADGSLGEAELHSFDKRGDLIIPMVKRRDTGEVVPMTRGKSEAGDDEVVQLTEQQFNDHFKSRWESGISKGALRDNDGVLYTGAQDMAQWQAKAQSSALREKSLDMVGQDPERSPAQKAQFYQVVNDTDDVDALKQVFASLGGDVEALITETEAAATAEWEKSAQGTAAREKQNSEEDRTPLQRALNPRNQRAMGRTAGDRMSVLGITDPEEYDMLQTVTAAVEESGINAAGGKSGFLFQNQTNEDYGKNTAAEDFYDKQSNKVAVAKAIFRNPELKTEFDKLGPLAFHEKYGDNIQDLGKPQGTQSEPSRTGLSQGGYTPEGTTIGPRPTGPSAVAPQLKTQPPFELTADNIRSAIKNKTEKVTAEQTTEINSFLNRNGIETDQDLIEAANNGTIAPEDAFKTAYIMGMTHKGTTSERMGEAQKLINAFTFGDRDVGIAQKATMDYNAAGSARAGATLRLNYEKHNLAIKQYDTEAGQKVVTDTEAWANKLFAAVGYMEKGDDGEYSVVEGAAFDGTKEQANKIGKLISMLIPKINQASSSGVYTDADGEPTTSPQSQAYLDRLNPALNFYAQALANADEGSIFGGQFWADFFRPNAGGTIDFDLKRIRIARKGSKGAIQRIAYVDEDGVNSQEIDMSDIQGDNPIVARLLAKAAIANGMVK
tara:strand:+ start:116 stop:2404 length:2289 start_codon:yes stop_codon:yes gene_type:complete